MIQTRRPQLAAVRDAALASILRVPAIERWAVGGGWKPPSKYRRGLVRRARPRLPGEAEPFPQPNVMLLDGQTRPLDEGSVLGSRLSASTGIPGLWAPSRVPSPTRCDAGVLGHWFGCAGAPLALVRPDRHVYALLQPGETASALCDLARRLRGRGMRSTAAART